MGPYYDIVNLRHLEQFGPGREIEREAYLDHMRHQTQTVGVAAAVLIGLLVLAGLPGGSEPEVTLAAAAAEHHSSRP